MIKQHHTPPQIHDAIYDELLTEARTILVQDSHSNGYQADASPTDQTPDRTTHHPVHHLEASFLSSLVFRHDGMMVDTSRQQLSQRAYDLLLQLCQSRGVTQLRDSIWNHEKVNITENNTIDHMWWRTPPPSDHPHAGIIKSEWHRVETFVKGIHEKNAFTDVVNIGIGGSDLGPALVYDALKPFSSNRGLRAHFVSNVDGTHLHDVLHSISPHTSMFVIVSKTFTTQETLRNLDTVKEWLKAHHCKIGSQIVAITAHPDRPPEHGFSPDQIFNMLNSTGGRFSVWSPAGLTAILALGWDVFTQFLAGGASLDKHFLTTEARANIPMIMAMMEYWNRNILGVVNPPDYASRAVIPYDQRLERLPAYLQQLEMESNGKIWKTQPATQADSLTHSPEHTHSPPEHKTPQQPKLTAPVIWGATGTVGQHAFFQALHQGTDIIPSDIILSARPTLQSKNTSTADIADDTWHKHHHILVANAIGQAEALWNGRLRDLENQPWRAFTGKRPVSVIMMPQLTPHYLGMLIALYENKVICLGGLWSVNSFDQWGVELGKEIANRLLHDVKYALSHGAPQPQHETSPSIQNLINYLKENGSS